MQDVPTTTDWLMGICNSRMYFGRADRFTPPVMEGPQRAVCGACWKCHSCDDRLCSGAPPEGMRYNGTQLRTDYWAAPAPGSTPLFYMATMQIASRRFTGRSTRFRTKRSNLGAVGTKLGRESILWLRSSSRIFSTN